MSEDYSRTYLQEIYRYFLKRRGVASMGCSRLSVVIWHP